MSLLNDVVAKARSSATESDLLPLLEVMKARRNGGAQRHARDVTGRFIIPGATVSVTFEDGTNAEAPVKSVSGESVTVTVGGKPVKAPLDTTLVTKPAGVDDQGFDELDREDASRVAWLSGRWPNADRLTQLRAEQREQPPEAWVLHDKDVGTSPDATLPAEDVPVEVAVDAAVAFA